MKSGLYGIGAFVTAFAVAQGAKFLISYFRKDKKGRSAGLKAALKSLGRSGGMPSGHSSSMTALAVFLGLSEGFDSAIFAVVFAVAVIVIYDAVNVRRAVGEHGKLLNKIAENDGDEETVPQKLVEGHTKKQAIAGIFLGAMIGAATFLIFASTVQNG